MNQLVRLKALFLLRILLIWHVSTILLIVASFVVPMLYESPDADGLFSGDTNLAAWAFTLLIMSPALISELFRASLEGQLLEALAVFCSLLGVIAFMSLIAYTILTIAVFFHPWQQQFQLRFGLLGLNCVGIVSISWLYLSYQSSQSWLLWGFKIFVSAIVLGLLWESVNYTIYRRQLSR